METLPSILSEIELPQWYEDFEVVRSTLLNINEDEIEYTQEMIEQSAIYYSHQKLIAELIVYISPIREQNQKQLAQLVYLLSQNNNIFKNQILELSTGVFLRQLYLNQVFSLENIKEKLETDPSQKIYFAPELDLHDNDESTLLFEQKVYLSELAENNWQLFNEIIENHCQRNSIEHALRNDDNQYFFELTSNINFVATSELLAKAAFYGSENVFRFLLVSGAQITEAVTISAVKGGCAAIIRLCLQNNGNFEKCLKAAAEYHRDDIFDWIYENMDTKELPVNEFIGFMNPRAVLHAIFRGVDPNEFAKYKTTCLHDAVKNDDDLLALTLIKNGASPDAKDINGMTPLHYAHSRKIVKILIDAGADIEARDNSGATPLFAAVLRNENVVIRALYDFGANINATNFTKKTPYMLAKEWKNSNAADFLAHLGCSVAIKTEKKNNSSRGYYLLL